MHRLLINPVAVALLLLLIVSHAESQVPIQVPEGFIIKKVADNALATNIYSLTVDANGHTVVAGPGYVKRLIDDDADGVYDRTQLISEVPRNGAQGLYFDGSTLYAVGDQGVLRMADSDENGVCDPPELVYRVKTGGEHDAHALRKGLDNQWYLLCGNGVPIPQGAKQAASWKTTQAPHAGFLLRLDEDFKNPTLVCDGFRNPYDFDFNADSEVLTYDSDGERDISLPWYQPTRVYRLRPGDSAGWMTASWKHPDYFATMPDVIGRLGRGSPTGVVCYQHHQFPADYWDALFVLDWTLGRIVAFKRNADGSYLSAETFASPQGATAFAVTDAEVAPDGSLLVSVGGRGIEGSVYRISASQGSPEANSISGNPTPQMNSSWSRQERAKFSKRASWATVMKRLNDTNHPVSAKLQAIDLAHQHWGPASPDQFADLQCYHPRVVRKLFNSMSSGPDRDAITEVAEQLFVRAQQLEFGSSVMPLTEDLLHWIPEPEHQDLTPGLGAPWTPPALAAHVLNWNQDFERKFGFSIPRTQDKAWPAVFDGYYLDDSVIQQDLTEPARQSLLSSFRASSGNTRLEWARLMAIARYTSPELQTELLGQITDDSHPVDDIHYLIVLTRSVRIARPTVLRKMVDALLNIRPKIQRLGLPTDRNWPIRMRELQTAMIREFKAGDLIAEHPEILRPENRYLILALNSLQKDQVRMYIADSILQNPDNVSSDDLDLLGSASDNVYGGLIRSFSNDLGLTDSVIRSLARTPIREDLPLFRRGLKRINRDTWRLSAIGLRKLRSRTPADTILVLNALKVLGSERADERVRNELLRFLQTRHPEVNVHPEFNPIDQWDTALERLHPEAYAEQTADRPDTVDLRKRLKRIELKKGDTQAGRQFYVDRLCARCHDGGTRLGPSLNDVGTRFNDSDLLKAVVDPDQLVPVRYRAIKVQTIQGDLYYGAVVYESADGLVMTDRQGNPLRIDRESIEQRAVSNTSLMPQGLLDGATDQQIADLLAYLKTLK